MMDLATIKQLSRDAARVARKAQKVPVVPADADRAVLKTGEPGGFHNPNLGDHRPTGWKLVNQHFVDKSGFSGPGEPAMQLPEFLKLVARSEPGNGFAMIEEGQFQAWVGEFAPTKRRKK